MTWLLGILGLGGVGIVATFLLGGGPVLMLYGAKALSFAKTIPPKVWYALAIVAALAGAYFLHGHRVKSHDKALVAATITARDAQWSARLAKEHTAALAWKAKADQLAATIAQDERTKHEEALRLNAATADALRLRGPGAASAAHCGQGYHPGLAAGSGGREQAAAASDATRPQVPADDRAIVPWSWLTERAKEHDDLLDEATRWRENDARQRANWPKGAAEKP